MAEKIDREIWLPIKGYEGLYEVSSFGNVRSLDRMITHPSLLGDKEQYLFKGRILKPNILKGYHYVHLQKDGHSKGVRIHRLVAEYFLSEQPSPNHQVNHIDGNKDNNRADNLEWVTPKENTHHAIRTGLRKPFDEERLKTASDAAKKVWSRPGYRAAQSQKQKESWERNREERSKAIKEGIWRAKNGRKEINQET